MVLSDSKKVARPVIRRRRNHIDNASCGMVSMPPHHHGEITLVEVVAGVTKGGNLHEDLAEDGVPVRE